MQNRYNGLPVLIDSLHKKHMRFVLILDPAITVDYEVFVRGKEVDVHEGRRSKIQFLQANAYITWPNASTVQTEVNSL